MSTPAEVVAEAFSEARTEINAAEAMLATFTSQLSAAVQVEPLIDVTFEAVSGPSVGSAPSAPGSAVPTYSAPSTYSSSLITSLASLLSTRLAGGTGLNSSVETAIWDRARDREAALAQANIDDAQRTAEGFGFHLPTGVLAAQVREAQRNLYDKSSDLSRQIAIKQAELEQSNMIDAVQKATTYEDTLTSILQRREQVAVAVFQAEVEAFNAELNGFRAEVESYSAQVSADMKHWEAEIAQLSAQQTYVLTAQKLNTEIARANLATVLEAAKTGAQVYAQLTAAAYSMIHASASVSAGSSNSVGYTYNNTTATSPASVTAI
jgi:hypothetical protein